MYAFRVIYLNLLNPLSIVTTLKRILFRFILKDRRFDRKWSQHYRKLLDWSGIPVGNSQYEYYATPGVKLFIPSVDKGVFEDVYVNSFYDAYFTPREGETVIDIGAHVGAYSVKAGKKMRGTGTVLAIEPHPTSFRIMQHNIAVNRLQNVVLMNIALGSEAKSTVIYTGRNLKTTSVLPRSGIKEAHTVECKRLDGLLEELNVSRVDLIKIDVEGAETEIIRGAFETLKKHKSKIVIAAYHYPNEAFELSDLLKQCGYFVHEKTGYLYATRRENGFC